MTCMHACCLIQSCKHEYYLCRHNGTLPIDMNNASLAFLNPTLQHPYNFDLNMKGQSCLHMQCFCGRTSINSFHCMIFMIVIHVVTVIQRSDTERLHTSTVH